MKKYVLLLISLVILGGCTVNASMVVDKSNHVKEYISLSESNDMIELNQMSKEELINSTYEFYKSSKLSGYETSKEYNDDGAQMKFYKEYDNICDAFNKSAFADFFDNIDCSEEEDYYEINATTEKMLCTSECLSAKNIEFTIELPERAIENDADVVEDDKYTWNYTRDQKGNLNLKVKKYKSVKDTIKNVGNSPSTLYIIIGSAVIIVFVIILLLYSKYRKNKIEY